MHSWRPLEIAGNTISFSGEVYADELSGMSTGIMQLVICFIHLFYFAVYQAGFSISQIIIGPKEMPSQFVFSAEISISSQLENLNPCMMGSNSWSISMFVMIIIIYRYLCNTLCPKRVDFFVWGGV